MRIKYYVWNSPLYIWINVAISYEEYKIRAFPLKSIGSINIKQNKKSSDACRSTLNVNGLPFISDDNKYSLQILEYPAKNKQKY